MGKFLFGGIRKFSQPCRKRYSLTQGTLTVHLDKPQSYVSKYESGERRLDVIEFLTIAQKMEVDPIALLREAGLLE
ncbi:helix-turn-helix transcriptional regulator [uncultured Desulfovibrio sp.]|uniref:helix-turn-helix domain-containing protein n=1 Tax=uncultured Desulfovibrio sp. TaxID=167968 RepID=UPI002626176E|nr:helix-turn-helix transcriptional regulator [uncultured Desulfovibrio sp.]